MARNGSGTYSLPAGNPVTGGTTISSTWANNTLSDIGTALTGSLAKDGQTVPTNNLPMGGFKFTGLAAGSSNGESVRFEQLALASLGAAASGANADITALNFAGGVTTTTQAVGDNSTKVATTAFVKSQLNTFTMGGGFSTNTTLTSGNYGQFIYVSGAITITLPVADATNIGRAITLFCYSTGTITVATQSSQALYYQGTSTATSAVVFATGDSVTFVNYSGAGWMIASAPGGIGYGQTWQNVTGSRALGTTYYNTTGKPVTVSIGNLSAAGGNNYWSITVNATVVGYTSASIAASSPLGGIFIVPTGASYSVASVSGSTALGYWFELR
jgi:hypothetical protein